MNQNYTNKQAMDKLGLISRSALYHLKRTSPQALVVVNKGTDSDHVTMYDKHALDKFVEILECVKTQAHEAN